MFKRLFIVSIFVLLGTMSVGNQLQAMFCPGDWYFQRDEKEAESSENEKASSRFGMIEDDDFLAAILVKNLIKGVVEEEDFTDARNFGEAIQIYNNKLVDALKLFNESEIVRLSVQRKVLITLCDLCDDEFKALSNSAKSRFLAHDLQAKLEENVEYQTHCKREIIELHKFVGKKISEFKQKLKNFALANPFIAGALFTFSAYLITPSVTMPWDDGEFWIFRYLILNSVSLGMRFAGVTYPVDALWPLAPGAAPNPNVTKFFQGYLVCHAGMLLRTLIQAIV